jgi:hypothetical protein
MVDLEVAVTVARLPARGSKDCGRDAATRGEPLEAAGLHD